MGAIWKGIVMLVLWRFGGLRARVVRRSHDPSERHVGAPAWVERLIALLLVLLTCAALTFAALFIFDPNTQLLGLALGSALALLAGALSLGGNLLVRQETKVEQRPSLGDEEMTEEVSEQVASGAEGITRRRLLAGAAGAAGAGLTGAVVVPVVALGPGLEKQLRHTPWHAGRALVDEHGRPIFAAEILPRGFQTAFPEGADKEDLGAPVVVVRVNPATLKLPPRRASWAPQGILAYSKICTHAACAISLFRDPLNPSTVSRGPALVCPCHYSTFDVLDGGSVEFGPAGRPLPQLPLSIDENGQLRAAGPMSGPVGPSWWGDPA